MDHLRCCTRSTRPEVRRPVWALAWDAARGADGGLVIVGLDASLMIWHSRKERLLPTTGSGPCRSLPDRKILDPRRGQEQATHLRHEVIGF
jgi:hypothetical protein